MFVAIRISTGDHKFNYMKNISEKDKAMPLENMCTDTKMFPVLIHYYSLAMGLSTTKYAQFNSYTDITYTMAPRRIDTHEYKNTQNDI